MELRKIEPRDTERLLDFFAGLPPVDRSFLHSRIDRPAIETWQTSASHHWLCAAEDEPVEAYMALIPHPGYSSHVASLRLAVAADRRRRGLGRSMARRGLLEGLQLGLRKITVEVAADKEGDISMFTSIGFRPEALLEDHIRDGDGRFHDLVLLAHNVSQVEDDLVAIGADQALGLRGDR